MVSSAKIEMTASVFMDLRVVLDCGQKRQPIVHFQDDPGKDRDRPAPLWRLNQPELRRVHAREDALDGGAIETVHATKKTGEHRAIVGQNRIVAVLEQGRLL